MRTRLYGGLLLAFALAAAGAGWSHAGQDRVTCCEKRLTCCARGLACCRTRPPQQNPCCGKGYDCCNRYPAACCQPRK